MPVSTGKLLVIGHVWPEPVATAAGGRMIQLLECFKDLGYQIVFASAAAKTDYSTDLCGMGITEVEILLNDSGFDNYIKELNPTIVMFDRFMTEEQYGWRVAENIPSCLRILNTEDLHSLRSVREQCIKEQRPFSPEIWLESDIAKRELASIYRSDLTIIISSFEFTLLNNFTGIPEDLLMYLPFLHTHIPGVNVNQLKPHEERKDFVFIGNGKHRPNVDAIQWLYKDIWPLINKELPDCRLHVYGAYLPEYIITLNKSKKGFLVHGWTKSSLLVLQNARVNLVPLRYGAGLKGKLMEAMICGTPSVATEAGMEGFPNNSKNKLRPIQSIPQFVSEAINLYTNPLLWKEKQNEYQDVLSNEFDRSIYIPQLRERLSNITTDIKSHRSKNIVGALLLHHTMASTKYLSKWIETKNQYSSS